MQGIIVAILVAGGLGAGYLVGTATQHAETVYSVSTATSVTTSVTTATSTLTSVSAQDITAATTPCPPVANYSSVEIVENNGSYVFSTSKNGWYFAVTLSGLDMYQGMEISAELVNISNQTQNIRAADPLINPMYYCTYGPSCGGSSPNGPPVGMPEWVWNPPNIDLVNVSIPAGGCYFSGPYFIRETGLAPSDYRLVIWPLIEPSGTIGGDYSIGQSLMIDATLGESLEISEPMSLS